MSGTNLSVSPDFSVGNDCRLVLIMDVIGRVDLQHVTGFHTQQVTKEIRVARLNDTPLATDIPGGWHFTFTIDRADPTADNLAATMEAMYWNGQRVPKGSVYQYINEPDGSTSTFLFQGASITLNDAGNWQQESAVRMSLRGFSGRRLSI